MDIRITSKNGVVLKTANKYCTEDINVAIDSSLLKNDVEDTTLLGNTYTFIENPDISSTLNFDLEYEIIFSDGTPETFSGLAIGYFQPADANVLLFNGHPIYIEGYGWENTFYRTITVTGGADVNSPEALAYFKNNAVKNVPTIELVEFSVDLSIGAAFGAYYSEILASEIVAHKGPVNDEAHKIVKGTLFVIRGGEGPLLNETYTLEGDIEVLELTNDVMVLAINGPGSLSMTNILPE